MTFRWLALLLFACLLSACSPTEPQSEEKPLGPPNIILIFTDDQGYSDLGIMGFKDDVRTPHIDALARRGVIMSQGYVSSPSCVPSRAALLTGRHQNSFGLDTNEQISYPEVQNEFNSLDNIASRLKHKDYATAMAGKWHLGRHQNIVGLGFDQYWITEGEKDKKSFEPQDYELDPEFVETGYHVDKGSKFASAFIKKNKDKPFFFYWAPRAPHVPLDAPKAYLDRFPNIKSERRKQGLAMISAIDDGVGNIVATLKDNGLLDSTMIVFISDNGAPLRINMREDGPVTSGWDGSLNQPLTGEKGLLMEGGIRVPFIVSWPERLPENSQYELPILTIDVAPTVFAAAGLNPSPDLPGKNLIPYLNDEIKTAPHEYMYWKYGEQEAIRAGDWKLIKFDNSRFLYNLANDLTESKNLIDDKHEKGAELEVELNNWLDTLPEIPVYLEDRVKKRVRRKRIFYDYYLDHKRDQNLDRLYVDWVYGMTISDLEGGRRKKLNEAREKKKTEESEK